MSAQPFIHHNRQRLIGFLDWSTKLPTRTSTSLEKHQPRPQSSAPFGLLTRPFRDLGDSIIRNPHPDGQTTLMHGVVRDLDTKKGIPNAVIDIWQASANGKYDFQDPDNQEPNNSERKNSLLMKRESTGITAISQQLIRCQQMVSYSMNSPLRSSILTNH